MGNSGKEPTCQRRRHKRCGFDPWVRKIPWRRAWQPTQYSCLENPMDREVWWDTVYRVAESQTRLKRFNTHRVGKSWRVEIAREGIFFPHYLLLCLYVIHVSLCCSVIQSCPTLCDPWTVACQASLSFIISQSLLNLMSTGSMKPCNHLILCYPLLLLLSIFPSISVFPSELTLHIRWPEY